MSTINPTLSQTQPIDILRILRVGTLRALKRTKHLTRQQVASLIRILEQGYDFVQQPNVLRKATRMIGQAYARMAEAAKQGLRKLIGDRRFEAAAKVAGSLVPTNAKTCVRAVEVATEVGLSLVPVAAVVAQHGINVALREVRRHLPGLMKKASGVLASVLTQAVARP